MTKVALIHLSGQGDTQLTFVSLDTYRWVTTKSVRPPDIQVDLTLKDREDFDTKFPGRDEPATSRKRIIAELSRWEGSSPDNDRALAACDEFRKPGDPILWTLKDALKFAKAHDLEIEETYEGYIY